ncbi:hypothetical protein D7V97_31800, partial [Corallococcus sp. CA053C]
MSPNIIFRALEGQSAGSGRTWAPGQPIWRAAAAETPAHVLRKPVQAAGGQLGGEARACGFLAAVSGGGDRGAGARFTGGLSFWTGAD